MRASAASELRKFLHFHIQNRLFLSIFCWYIRNFVGLHVPTDFQMYQQNSEKALLGGGGAIAPLPPPLPSGYASAYRTSRVRIPLRSGSRARWKTLFNIVKAPFKMVELWCLCCMMMFRWTNKQPGIQQFWNLCSHYQYIYDWISPLNKCSGLPFILTQQSMRRNE